MNRASATCFAGLLLACGVAVAQDNDFSKVQIKVTKVAGNIYMLEGAGGNIGASVGDDGIVVVDDQYAPLADKIQAALKGITDKPVRFIINTHYHPDHTGSNEYFRSRRRSSRTTTYASASKPAVPQAMAAPFIWNSSRNRKRPCPFSPSIMT